MPTDLRNRPIPLHRHPPTALDYSCIPVDLCDPKSSEPLVDLADYGIAGHDYYARTDGLNSPYNRTLFPASPNIYCRSSLAAMLVCVNETLAAYGVELFVLNGYRSLEVQSRLWEFFVEQAREVLKAPSDENCIAFAGEYCSDPDAFDAADPHTWPTHITGGAIDTTLRARETGELLFMGSIFDEPSTLSHTQHFEMEFNQHKGGVHPMPASHAEALRNRRLLYWSMAGAGFANYPYEWWHFDWGTQMWVVNSMTGRCSPGNPQHAWYGVAS